ncbi:MAG: hypothetical protein OXB84_08210 [Halobacteriovoraceae bacterium]|nr:hypothetical protein [Halobacteriovoraceae bacterium]
MGKIPDQWAVLNKTLTASRWTNIFLCLLLLVSLFFLMAQQTRSPVVVVEDGKARRFHMGEYRKTLLGKEEITIFLKDFVGEYYSFDRYDPQLIVKRISPFSTIGFKNTLLEKSSKKFAKLKGKKIAQRVLDVKIHYQKNQVIATFVKLLRIGKVPFLIETQTAFKLQKGTPTRFNPMGIYVDGVIEHEKTP